MLHVAWNTNGPFVGYKLLPTVDIIEDKEVGFDYDGIVVEQIGVRSNTHGCGVLVLTFCCLITSVFGASDVCRWNPKLRGFLDHLSS